MRLLWPILLTTSNAMSGREAIAYWTAVYRGEPVPELHTDYPTQKAIERRLQAVDAHAANKPRGGDDDLEDCLLYTSPSPRDPKTSRMPSSA